MKENKFITFSFFIVLFGILILYPISFILIKKGITYVNTDNFKDPNYKESGLFINITNKFEQYKTAIENRAINYFPFYSNINMLDKNINENLNEILYNSLNIDYYPVGANADGEYIYKNSEHYILQNNLSTKELDERLNKQINFFNNLETDNLYIFLPDRFEFTNINNSVLLRDLNTYVEKFKASLNTNIKISEFKVDNINDYLKYFYKTDHHYNMYGAYESYKIIMNMLDKEYKTGIVFEINDLKYYGSIAKSAYLTDISDNFYDIDIDLGKYTVLVNDELNNDYKPKIVKKNKGLFYDRYVSYFNGMFGKVEYNFHNDNKNLLILSDSFSWQIDNLIASSYNKTFVINIRYDEYINNAFNIKKFIKENNIDDVLFLYETSSTIFDQYDYKISEKVVQ